MDQYKNYRTKHKYQDRPISEMVHTKLNIQSDTNSTLSAISMKLLNLFVTFLL